MENYKIYPKQFKNDKIPIEKNRCFVLMPFDSEYNYIYGTIKKELTQNGYICNRADEIAGSQPIINKIIREILRSHYIIADLTAHNPNVFYELGIAHCFKDAPNILIIKQRNYKIPFDLTHLTYIEYDANNLMFLTSTIKNFLENNRYISDFNEALNIKGIINGVTENGEGFVDYIQDYLKDNILIATDILNNNISSNTEESINNFLIVFDNMVETALSSREFEFIPGILKLYSAIYSSISGFYSTQQHLEYFLEKIFVSYDVAPEIVKQWKTDVVISLASEGKLLHICLPWIINYFTQTKSTKIDLNRYRLESFLLLSTREEVNEAIIAGIFSENQYVRETMSDMVGEKRLTKAIGNLVAQLNIEENYFVMRSIIQAISKLQTDNGLDAIVKWFDEKKMEIESKKYTWIFRHIYTALLRLDTTPQKNIAKKFKEDYKSYFEEYPI